MAENGQQQRNEVNNLRKRVQNLENGNGAGKQGNGTSTNPYVIPVNWVTWFGLSLIFTILLMVVFPVFQGMDFGKAFFGVLIVTLLTWFVYRAILWLLAIIAGRSFSLPVLLPSTLMGWFALGLAISVLYLGWGHYGPTSDSVKDSLSKLWNTVSEYSPLGAISSINRVGTDQNGSVGPAISGEPAEIASIPVKEGRHSVDLAVKRDAADFSLVMSYDVQQEGRDFYNVFPNGTEYKQQRNLRCWDKLPKPNPANCNPVLCRTGRRPDGSNPNQKECPYMRDNLGDLSSGVLGEIVLPKQAALSVNELSLILSAIVPGHPLGGKLNHYLYNGG